MHTNLFQEHVHKGLYNCLVHHFGIFKGFPLSLLVFFLFFPTKAPCQLRRTSLTEGSITHWTTNITKISCQTMVPWGSNGGYDLWTLRRLYTNNTCSVNASPFFWIDSGLEFFPTNKLPWLFCWLNDFDFISEIENLVYFMPTHTWGNLSKHEERTLFL